MQSVFISKTHRSVHLVGYGSPYTGRLTYPDLCYGYIKAQDGLETLEKVRSDVPDLVLLDVNMPVMGGTQAFAELRAINPSCRVIIVTGYGRDTVETSSFPGRIDAFMQKPFQQETLAHNVRRVLDGG